MSTISLSGLLRLPTRTVGGRRLSGSRRLSFFGVAFPHQTQPIPPRAPAGTLCTARIDVAFLNDCPCLTPVLRWESRLPKRVPYCTAIQDGHAIPNLSDSPNPSAMGKSKKKDEIAGQGVGSGVAYVQVLGLGSDTGDSAPSVLLFFDKRRYLFNAGEGFQRFCVEHKIRLSKVNNIFLTRVNSEAAGGLPGVLLTMNDASPAASLLAAGENIFLYGPPRLQTLVNAMRTFVNVRDCGLEPHEFGSGLEGAGASGAPETILEDENVTIRAVVLEAGAGAGAGSQEEPAVKRPRLREGGGGAGPTGNPAACYICQIPEIKGKFLPEKALALGVPKGPAFARLVRGMTVEVAGREVKPEEVMEPSVPGPVVAVVDCPTADYMAALLASPALAAVGAGGASGCMVHTGPAEVVTHPDYVAWMQGIGGSIQHIVCAAGGFEGQRVLASSAALHMKLGFVHPNVFPVPPEAEGSLPPVAPPGGSHAGTNMIKYRLRPLARVGFDTVECPKPVVKAEVHETMLRERPSVRAVVAKARIAIERAGGDGAGGGAAAGAAAAAAGAGAEAAAAVAAGVAAEAVAAREAVPEYMRGRDLGEVVFMGTGSAIPSKYRNVSGLFFNWFQHGGLLVDTGEGSYGQLCRRYGPAGALEVLRNLKMIWISHIHADHHVGAWRILSLRAALLGPGAPPLLVVGPRPLQRTLTQFARIEPLNFKFLDCAHTVGLRPEELQGGAPPAPLPELAQLFEEAKGGLGLTSLSSVDVIHCPHAFGLIMEHGSGLKVAYSGDTRPCPKLVEAARGVDVLIHEATFDDTLEEEAVAKRHSMTREAVESGRDMGAYRTVLTHFSQRYPKIPTFDESFTSTTCIAFDLMAANWGDVPYLPHLLPALKEVFEEQEGEEVAAAKAEEEGAGV